MGIFSKKIAQRAHPSANINWSEFFHGVTKATSGVTVTERSVMGLPAVWAGVNFISTTKAALPLHVYQKTAAGKKIADSHVVEKILNGKPNPKQDPFKFIETCCNQEILTGFSYCEKVTDGNGKLTALWPIPTWRVHGPILFEGRHYYRVTHPAGGTDTYLHEDTVLKIEGPYGGESILKLMVETFGLSISIDQFASNFFGRGANPGVVVRHPKVLTPEGHKNLQKKLGSTYEGLGNAFRLMLLDEGMEAQKLLHSLEENQLVSLKQFQITDVARILNLPPHILKDLTKSSFSNIETQSIELVIYSLLPRVKRYESVFNTFLIPEKDQGKYFVKFNLKGLMRGDDQSRAEFYTKMRRLGVFSVNDIRSLEDMNSIGKAGDVYHVSADMIPLTDAGQGRNLSKDHKEIAERLLNRADDDELSETDQQIFKKREKKMDEYQPLFQNAIQTIVNREVAAIKKHAGRDDFREWLEEFYEDLTVVVDQKVGPVLTAYSSGVRDLILDEIDMEDVPDEYEDDLTEYIDGFIEAYVGAGRGQMLALLGEDDSEEKIKGRVDEWYETKAEKESNRQVVSLMGAVASAIIIGHGFRLVWKNTSGKSCPYCSKMHNKTISKKSDYFIKKGAKLKGDENHSTLKVPHNTRYPQLHRGCKCIVTKG